LKGTVILSEHDRVLWGGELGAEVVYDEDEALSFNDMNGQASTHILGSPKRCVDNLETVGTVPHAVVKRIFEMATAVAEKLGVREGRYAVRINSGPGAGQESLHPHVMGVQRVGRP
jgi:diadenosine tetraphosphate (Ap4A) HIT family hydrolase